MLVDSSGLCDHGDAPNGNSRFTAERAARSTRAPQVTVGFNLAHAAI
jgi:hypothetical protein